jgi:hypothetical protein
VVPLEATEESKFNRDLRGGDREDGGPLEGATAVAAAAAAAAAAAGGWEEEERRWGWGEEEGGRDVSPFFFLLLFLVFVLAFPRGDGQRTCPLPSFLPPSLPPYPTHNHPTNMSRRSK